MENVLADLIFTIAKALVDKPDEVSLKETAGEKIIVFELKVADGEVGKVIGKEGKTAHAIRQILNATATKLGKRAVLEILE